MSLFQSILRLLHLAPAPKLPVVTPRPALPADAPIAAPVVPQQPQPTPVSAPSSLPEPSVTYPSPMVGLTSHGSPDEAPQLQSLGMQCVRIEYKTADRKARGAQYDLEVQERLKWHRAHGLDVLVLVDDWFGTMPYAEAVPLMASIAHRHPGTGWQVLNEKDAVDWYKGGDYAGLMAALVPAMKAADPACRVVGMGMSCTDGQDWAFMKDGVRQPLFLTEYLHANGPVLDGWSLHVYGPHLAPGINSLVKATQTVLQDKMPLFITEIGMDRVWAERAAAHALSDDVVDETQAAECVAGLNAAQELSVARVYFYALWDGGDYDHGFLRKDAVTERPVCAAMRVVLR